VESPTPGIASAIEARVLLTRRLGSAAGAAPESAIPYYHPVSGMSVIAA
jgi:hypothetical protein